MPKFPNHHNCSSPGYTSDLRAGAYETFLPRNTFAYERHLLMKHCMTLSSIKTPFQIVKYIRKMPSCQASLASSKLNCIFSKKRTLLICFTNIKYTILSTRQMSKRWIKSFFVSRTATKKINMLPMCNVNEMLNKKVFRVNKKSWRCTKKYSMSTKTRWCGTKKIFCAKKLLIFSGTALHDFQY